MLRKSTVLLQKAVVISFPILFFATTFDRIQIFQCTVVCFLAFCCKFYIKWYLTWWYYLKLPRFYNFWVVLASPPPTQQSPKQFPTSLKEVNQPRMAASHTRREKEGDLLDRPLWQAGRVLSGSWEMPWLTSEVRFAQKIDQVISVAGSCLCKGQITPYINHVF